MAEYLSVSSLNRYLKSKFDRDPYLERVYLTGEISNFRENNRYRQQYLTIKDEKSSIGATLADRIFHALDFQLENGMKVLLIGRVSMNASRAQANFMIEEIIPDGAGVLAVKLEQLKKKLTAEGLFEQGHKKPLPQFNQRVAVITAPSGAVIHDIITTIGRRFPMTNVVLYPSKVSGKGSAEELVANLERVNAREDIDLIIIGRGGGSIEDLWSFNEEILVRAIFDSRIPVISSVGHQTDTTLADFVADARAATPTAAAELATPNTRADLLAWLDGQNNQLRRLSQNLLQHYRERLEKLTNSVVFRQPERLYDGQQMKLDNLSERLTTIFEQQLSRSQHQQELLASRLVPAYSKIVEQRRYKVEQLYQNLLLLDISNIKARGFAIATNKDGKIVKSVQEVKVGESLELALADGQIKTEVIEK